MIVRLYHTFNEFNEIRIEGFHLPNILNRLKRVYDFDASKERAIMLLVDSSKRVEPLQVVDGFEIQDINAFDSLNILHGEAFKDIEGGFELLIIGILSATGVIHPNSALLDSIFAITDWVVMVTSITMNVFIPGSGLLLTAVYSAGKYLTYMGAHSDPAVIQQNAQQYQSNLFNGAGIIREQGGICPLIFGQPYASGVLLSSALVTSDQVA